ncbi:maleylacetate reductase [Nocardia sp. NPDC050799]|uniref:maleylacetate reductase n=1 Tax=Nocardia TaxID=1817 RepID=UPI001E436B97|nr:maleylacetate reductase [Nocardia fusca]
MLFGSGRIRELPEELDRLNLSRVVVICTPRQRPHGQEIAVLAGNRAHSVYAHATMHVPNSVVAAADEYVTTHEIDGAVVVGGGSAVGLGKALALGTGLPVLAVPTTYSGSEMTPIWGITDPGNKTTGRDVRVLPRTVIYDPDLTVNLPAPLSVSSGLNAMAHAAEALYAPDGSPLVEIIAGEAVRALATGLPKIAGDPMNSDVRRELLYGAWLAGTCLGATSMSLHHKLCHIIGGAFGLPHSEVHAIVLPHVLAYNFVGAPRSRELMSRAIGVDDPASWIHSVSRQIGPATSLHELGMREEDVEAVVVEAVANPYSNPRPITPEAIRSIVTHALTGSPPE